MESESVSGENHSFQANGLMYPLFASVAYCQRLNQNFGWKFVMLLTSAYFGVKGTLYAFINLAALPYYKNLGVSGRDYQVYGIISTSPWAMKALIGTVSDAVPLFGWHKASYIFGAALVGSLGFILLGSAQLSAQGAAVCFLLANLQVALIDLLVEGKYAELMQANPRSGSDVVTWVWMTYQMGALLAACVTGPLSDLGNLSLVFWLCVPIAAQIMVPVALGYLNDPRLRPGERGVRWGKVRAHPRLFGLAIAMAVCAFGQALLSLAVGRNYTAQLIYSLVASTLLCGLSWFCLPRGLAMCTLFLFLDSATYVRIDGALDYWFTADDTCVPGGPAFDYTYYTTYTRIVGSIAGWAGVVLFQSLMGTWRMRTIFWTTTLVRVAAGAFDVGLVLRWNIAIGLSDKAAYMLGDAIVGDLCGMLAFMPAVLLTSKLCPRDLEATTYALLAGFQNFGTQVARSVGVSMMTGFGLHTEAPCDWAGLPGLIVAAHMAVPLVMLPLTFVLLPDLSPQDDLVKETAAELLQYPGAALARSESESELDSYADAATAASPPDSESDSRPLVPPSSADADDAAADRDTP